MAAFDGLTEGVYARVRPPTWAESAIAGRTRAAIGPCLHSGDPYYDAHGFGPLCPHCGGLMPPPVPPQAGRVERYRHKGRHASNVRRRHPLIAALVQIWHTSIFGRDMTYEETRTWWFVIITSDMSYAWLLSQVLTTEHPWLNWWLYVIQQLALGTVVYLGWWLYVLKSPRSVLS